MANTSRDSNLFTINLDDIRNRLAEANAELTKRTEALLTTFEGFPDHLQTQGDLELARRLADDLVSQHKEVRQARLSDGRSFQDAGKAVKEFFGPYEKSLQQAVTSLVEKLTKATLEPPSQAKPRVDGVEEHATVDAPPLIDVAWAVESIDRDTVDLEALRRYFTDNSILAACKKHLTDHGPNEVRGVKYTKTGKL